MGLTAEQVLTASLDRGLCRDSILSHEQLAEKVVGVLRRAGYLLDPGKVAVDREALETACAALDRIWQAALTVQFHLITPYDEHPEWTPWTRWVKPALDEVETAEVTLRAALQGQQP